MILPAVTGGPDAINEKPNYSNPTPQRSMTPDYLDQLSRALWQYQAGRSFISTFSEKVTVNSTGEYDPSHDIYCNAEVIIDGIINRGHVLFSGTGYPVSVIENSIIKIAAAPCPQITRMNGSIVCQISLDIEQPLIDKYSSLRAGAGYYGCAAHLGSMDNAKRLSLLTRLMMDRLERKCSELMDIYRGCDQSWNETMYIMLLRTIGVPGNKEAFTELARHVTYSMISRERNSLMRVEALMLGTSGLLELYPDDTYCRQLKGEFEYLRKKYNISPMLPGQWSIAHNKPNNHPVLRIAQLAAFLCTKEFIFDNLIHCRSVEQLHNLFRAEASAYWSTHYLPSKVSTERPKRIGHMKANLLGINLAVPMILAYGNYLGDEDMKSAAIELLDKINHEDNYIVNGWRTGGVPLENASDSQALIQLYNEFCLKGLCWKCPVCKTVLLAGMAHG